MGTDRRGGMGRKSQVEIRKGHKSEPRTEGIEAGTGGRPCGAEREEQKRHQSPAISDPHRHSEAQRIRRSQRGQRKTQQESESRRGQTGTGGGRERQRESPRAA